MDEQNKPTPQGWSLLASIIGDGEERVISYLASKGIHLDADESFLDICIKKLAEYNPASGATFRSFVITALRNRGLYRHDKESKFKIKLIKNQHAARRAKKNEKEEESEEKEAPLQIKTSEPLSIQEQIWELACREWPSKRIAKRVERSESYVKHVIRNLKKSRGLPLPSRKHRVQWHQRNASSASFTTPSNNDGHSR